MLIPARCSRADMIKIEPLVRQGPEPPMSAHAAADTTTASHAIAFRVCGIGPACLAQVDSITASGSTVRGSADGDPPFSTSRFRTAMTSSSTSATSARRSRTLTLSTALWVFGIATSMVLIGLWGRSIAGDQVTLEASTRAVLESEIVNDRVTDWLGDAIGAAAQLSDDDVVAVVAAVDDTPEMQAAVDDVVDQAVTAALAPPGSVTVLDLSAAVKSLAPAVATAMEDRGVVADADIVRAAAQEVPGIVLSADDTMTVGGTAREVRGLLSKVVVIGLGGMLLFGAVAVFLNEDRVRQLRSLVIRIGVSAVTFAIIIRIGAWAVDPAGGRSPIAAGGAVVLKSNGHIFAAVAVAAAAIAAAISPVLLRRRRPGPAPPEQGGITETTGEQPVLVSAGVR